MSSPFVPIIPARLKWCGDVPYSLDYDEAYYPFDGGIDDRRHVFLDGNDLSKRWSALNGENTFYIGETGFGTGLNFLLTWNLWEQIAPLSACLHFISCENRPLNLADLKRSLGNWLQLEEQANQLIAHYPVLTPGHHHIIFANGRVKLTLMLGDALDCFEQLLICGDSALETQIRDAWFDAWYLDGFSLEKNDCKWSDSLLKIIAMLSRENTTLAAYTVAASIKLSLSHYGFSLAVKKGYHERHMLRAHLVQTPYIRAYRNTPWHVGYPEPAHERCALIIGAGLAGCFSAYFLAQRGWNVTLIDELDQVGMAGSANQKAVLFPQLSSYRSPLNEFMLTAFLYAHRVYQDMLQQVDVGELTGSILFASSEKEEKAFKAMSDWLAIYPDLGRAVSAEMASELAGIYLDKPGVYVPYSGWLNAPMICDFLVQHNRISVVTNKEINAISHHEGSWEVGDYTAPVLILANGHKINTLAQSAHLPIKGIRGQMTIIPATKSSSMLKLPLCAAGHVVPACNNHHYLGATYTVGVNASELYEEDNRINKAKLAKIASSVKWSKKTTGHWAGVRAATPDYLPLMGRMPNTDEFIQQLSGLQSNAKRWIAKPGSYYPGLYACAGFGSRGLTSIPLCAQLLAGLINKEMNWLPRNLVHALSPARFLRKDITRSHTHIPTL